MKTRGAQNVVNEATLSTDAALQVASAALAQCRQDGQNVTVPVVDHAGREKIRPRDDGAAGGGEHDAKCAEAGIAKVKF